MYDIDVVILALLSGAAREVVRRVGAWKAVAPSPRARASIARKIMGLGRWEVSATYLLRYEDGVWSERTRRRDLTVKRFECVGVHVSQNDGIARRELA